MWDSTPWAVRSARHSAEVGRLLSYAATSGAEGTVGAADLKVSALVSPGGSVRVAPGGIIMLNRYGGGGQQSYVGRNPVEHTVAIQPTTSAGGRSDLIVARVIDPQYEGAQPPDPYTFQYMLTSVIQGVSSSVTTAHQLNLGYPAVALARIDIPVSTSNITNAMITDLRNPANPRTQRRIFAATAGSNQTVTGAGFVPFPTYAPSVVVPPWATYVSMVATITGIGNVGSAEGIFFSKLGGKKSADLPYSVVDSGERGTIVVALTAPVSDIAGTTVNLSTYANRTVGPGYLTTLNGTQVVFDVWFEERAI